MSLVAKAAGGRVLMVACGASKQIKWCRVEVKSAWMLARCDVVVVEVASEQGKEEGGKWEGKVEAKQRHGDRQHCAAARHDRFRPSLVDAARERRVVDCPRGTK